MRLDKEVRPIKNYVAEHSVTFDFVFQLLGQGNYVVSYGQTQIDGVPYAQYDIFRLENGLIVGIGTIRKLCLR